MMVIFQVEVFWVVALCSVVVGYRHFGGPYSIEHHAMKAYWGSGDIAPRFTDLGPRWSPQTVLNN